MTDAPKQLDYAPPLPWHRRRTTQRRLILLAVLLMFPSAYWWAPPAWRHVQLLYWQRQCMNHQFDPDQVIWSSDGTSAGVPPEAWDRFYALLSPPGLRSRGTLFLHRMETEDGTVRLVAVDLFHVSSGHPEAAWYSTRIIRPARLWRRPVAITEPVAGVALNIQDRHGIRFFGGQPDPENPSHFTIEYEAGGSRRTIDGWLLDDATLLLETRPPHPDDR